MNQQLHTKEPTVFHRSTKRSFVEEAWANTMVKLPVILVPKFNDD